MNAAMRSLGKRLSYPLALLLALHALLFYGFPLPAFDLLNGLRPGPERTRLVNEIHSLERG